MVFLFILAISLYLHNQTLFGVCLFECNILVTYKKFGLQLNNQMQYQPL